jgi:hypothetical protein
MFQMEEKKRRKLDILFCFLPVFYIVTTRLWCQTTRRRNNKKNDECSVKQRSCCLSMLLIMTVVYIDNNSSYSNRTRSINEPLFYWISMSLERKEEKASDRSKCQSRNIINSASSCYIYTKAHVSSFANTHRRLFDRDRSLCNEERNRKLE